MLSAIGIGNINLPGTDPISIAAGNAITGREAHVTGDILGTSQKSDFFSNDYLEVIPASNFDREDVLVFSTWQPEWAQRVYGRAGSSKTRLDYSGSFLLGTIEVVNGEPTNFTQLFPNAPKLESEFYSKTVSLSLRVTVKTPVETEPVTITVPVEVSMTSDLGTMEVKFPGKQNTVKVNLPGQNNSPIHLQLLGVESKDYSSINEEDKTEFTISTNQRKEFKVFGRLFTESDPITSGNTVEVYPNQVVTDSNGSTQLGPAEKVGTIEAYFRPNFGLSLKEAAELSGFRNFNWYQKVTYDNANTYRVPWTDPPRDTTISGDKLTDNLPYYLNQKPLKPNDPLYVGDSKIGAVDNGRTLRFSDDPAVGGAYFSHYEKHFETFLVGVRKDYEGLSDALYRFSWESDRTKFANLGGNTLANLGIGINDESEFYTGGIKNVQMNLAISQFNALGSFYATDVKIDENGNTSLLNAGKDSYLITSPIPLLDSSFFSTPTPLPTPVVTASDDTSLDDAARSLILTDSTSAKGIGNALDNVMVGNSSNNILNGKGGNDLLIGNSGNDTLLGEIGNDVLVGGEGKDTLKGNTGADQFIFSGLSQQAALRTSTFKQFDRISDFNFRQGDRFRLNFDANLRTSELPEKLFYAGRLKGSLRQVIKHISTNSSQIKNGKQTLSSNQAIIFQKAKQTFLLINDGSKGFSVHNDFLVDITGIIMKSRNEKIGVLNVPDYFI